jgi:hypothetical protein
MERESAQAEWQPLGRHLIRLTEDTLYLQVHGNLELDDVRGMVERCAAIIVRNGYYLTVVDASDAGSMTPEARLYSAKWSRDNPDKPGLDVVYGANIVVRTVISMINRATSLISGRPSASLFVKDESAAEVCLAEGRQRLRAQAAQNRLS